MRRMHSPVRRRRRHRNLLLDDHTPSSHSRLHSRGPGEGTRLRASLRLSGAASVRWLRVGRVWRGVGRVWRGVGRVWLRGWRLVYSSSTRRAVCSSCHRRAHCLRRCCHRRTHGWRRRLSPRRTRSKGVLRWGAGVAHLLLEETALVGAVGEAAHARHPLLCAVRLLHDFQTDGFLLSGAVKKCRGHLSFGLVWFVVRWDEKVQMRSKPRGKRAQSPGHGT